VRSVGLTSGGLSIAIERLERVGYIGRFRHLDDRRSVLVEVTEAIVPLVAEVFGALIERINVRFGQYARDVRCGLRAGLASDLTTGS
jgi:DNA-binding MarR family transcriptional regulator